MAATAPFGADVLERLAARREIAYLLTRPDRPRGRGRSVGPPPAKEVAERLGIEVRQPERLAGFEPDADAVVVVAYGALIPEELLDRALWLNVHPSLLPRWRGAAPVERAIMAGDRETGVTIHRTTAELDAGPIAAQQSFPIEPEDDAGAIYARAAPIAAELLEGVLADPSFTPQPEEGRDLRRQDHGRRPAARLVRTGGGGRQPRPGALAAHRRAGRARGAAGDRLARAGGGRPRPCPSRCSRKGSGA